MAGSEEMANGNDVNRMYADAVTAQLGERVTNLGRRQTDLESEMRSGFKQMETSFMGIAAEMRTSIAALSTKFAERNQTQWPILIAALGVVITILAGLGVLSLQPIKDNNSRLEAALVRISESNQAAIAKLAETMQETTAKITENMVTQKEMEWRSARGAEDRLRTEAAIADLRDTQVPRKELERVWQSDDQKWAAMQKQVDELKQNDANQYNSRDFMIDTRDRLGRFEREFYSSRSNGTVSPFGRP